MPLAMRCRFAPDEHGTFANAVKLQQHYIAEHADVYVPPEKATCPECGRKFAPTYLAEHRREHGVEPNTLGSRRPSRRPSRQLPSGPFRCDLCGALYGSRDTMRHHIRNVHAELDGPWRDYSTPIEKSPNGLAKVDRAVSNGAPSHVGPWTVDDIVLPVVEQLAAPRGLVPVGHMAAIFAWREATAAMLSAVTR